MKRRHSNIRKALIGAILPLLRVLPPRLAARTVSGIGRAEYRLSGGVRQRVDAGIERGRGYFGGGWDRRSVGPALVGNQILCRTRDRLLDGLSDARATSAFEVEGLDNLEAARADGKGVVLLGNHFGANMMPAHWLLRNGYPLRLVTERPRHVSKFLSRHFQVDGPTGQRKLFFSRGATPAESASSIMRASKVLSTGGMVLIAGDVRWPGRASAPARFLGREHRFSTTWIILAALNGAPVVPVFCRIGEDGTHHLQFHDAFRLPAEAREPERAVAWVQGALLAIEEQVREYPESSNDYFFWDEDVSMVSASA